MLNGGPGWARACSDNDGRSGSPSAARAPSAPSTASPSGAFRIEAVASVEAVESNELAGPIAMSCASVRGFHEAATAARNARAALPQRLAILAPDEALDLWLKAWAEDAEQVRRTFRIERGIDGRAVTIVATIASHGYGVETSLAIESALEATPEHEAPFTHAAEGDALPMLRSGVHPKALIDALLSGARHPG